MLNAGLGFYNVKIDATGGGSLSESKIGFGGVPLSRSSSARAAPGSSSARAIRA